MGIMVDARPALIQAIQQRVGTVADDGRLLSAPEVISRDLDRYYTMVQHTAQQAMAGATPAEAQYIAALWIMLGEPLGTGEQMAASFQRIQALIPPEEPLRTFIRDTCDAWMPRPDLRAVEPLAWRRMAGWTIPEWMAVVDAVERFARLLRHTSPRSIAEMDQMLRSVGLGMVDRAELAPLAQSASGATATMEDVPMLLPPISFHDRGRTADGDRLYWVEPVQCWLLIRETPTAPDQAPDEPMAWSLSGTKPDGDPWQTDWYPCATVAEALHDVELYLAEYYMDG